MALKLSESSMMPKMKQAMVGWQIVVSLLRYTQKVVDGLVTQTTETITFQGAVQPLSPRQVSLKPEGQRAWEWLQVHNFSGKNNLSVNDRIGISGNIYKVMAILDYSQNGFIEYHLVGDYQ